MEGIQHRPPPMEGSRCARGPPWISTAFHGREEQEAPPPVLLTLPHHRYGDSCTRSRTRGGAARAATSEELGCWGAVRLGAVVGEASPCRGPPASGVLEGRGAMDARREGRQRNPYRKRSRRRDANSVQRTSKQKFGIGASTEYQQANPAATKQQNSI